MTCASLASVADKQVLYLTTVGCRTGLPREIEIWFVVWCERLYLFAETREAAGWVRNIRRNPKVMVRIGEWRTDATARVLDRHTDRKLWDQVAAIANRKYGWGDGLPVEIAPLRSRAPHSDPRRIPMTATETKLLPIELPAPVEDRTLSFWGAVAQRRTIREIAATPLSLAQLSNLLWVAFGVNRKVGPDGRQDGRRHQPAIRRRLISTLR